MRNLEEMEALRHVLTRQSFVLAARELNTSPATITRRIASLEESLGVKLVNRNTRRVSATDAGKRYLALAQRILDDVNREELLISRMNRETDGPLKVLVSKSFGNLHMGSAVGDFMSMYPGIETSIIVSDASLPSLDPIEGGFDLAIRLGEPKASGLFARSLGEARWIACASPAYLEKAGTPSSPADLSRHKCVRHEMYQSKAWEFIKGSEKHVIKIKSQVNTNSVIIARDLAISGLGVTLIPTYCINNELKTGTLVQVLSQWKLPSQTIRALYPHSRLQATKVKVFLDFMQKRFKTTIG